MLATSNDPRLLALLGELAAARDLASLIGVVRDRARDLVRCDGITVVLLEGDRVFYREETAVRPLWKGRRSPAVDCISGWAIENRTPVAIEDVTGDPRIPPEASQCTFVKSLLVVPIGTTTRLGAIGAYWGKRHRPTQAEAELLQALADAAAIAAGNAALSAARRDAERALAERETELRLVTDTVPALISFIDREHRYRFVNGAYETWFGLRREEILGAHMRHVIGAEAYDSLRPRVEAALAGRRVTYEAEVNYRTGRRWIEATYTPRRGPSGDVEGIVALVNDATERKRAEELLAASEERLRQLIEHTPAPVAMFDRDMRYLIASRRWLTDYGVQGDVKGRSHYEAFPDLPERWKEIHRRCLAGAVERCDEDVWERADGSVVWVKWEIRPWRDEAGAIGGLVIYSENITDRKRSEQALRDSEAQLRLVCDSAPVLLAHCDREGRYRFVNKAYAERFGHAPETLVGRRMADVVGHRAHALLEPHLARVLAGEAVEFEAEVPYETGGASFMHLAYVPERDASGAVVGLVMAILNVTDRRRAEAARSHAQRRLETISNNATVGLLMLDERRRITFINPAGERIVGASFAECRGRTLDEVVRRTRPDGSLDRGEDVFLRRDGTACPVAFTASPIVDEGRPIGTVIELRDVTEEKRAQRALRESEGRFRAVASHAPVGLFETDLGGDCTYANEKLGDLAGLPAGVAVERWCEAIHPEEAEAVFAAWDETTRAEAPFRSEFRLRTADGRIVWVACTAVPRKDSSGAFVGYLGTIMDITARKAAETALRDSEARFRALADNIAQLAWMADARGAILWFNKRWFDYTGTAPEQVRGWGWLTLHHPEHRDRVQAGWDRALAAGRAWEDTFPLRGADGGYRWFLSRAFPIHDETGKVLRWFGTNTDVTEQRATEEALRRAVQTRDAFLTIASHELRTPLTPLTLQLQSIERIAEKEGGRIAAGTVLTKVSKAEKQVRHMEMLVNRLIEVSRLAEKRLEIERETVDLSMVVADVAERMRPEIDASGSSFTLDAPRPVVGSWDRLRLDQVVSNLIGNALKYGRGRPVEVAVRSSGDEAVLTVRDQGIGIPSADQERIFGRFERAVSENNYGGFGLGLWISRQFVEAMGGTIAVESERDVGSTFRVTLPARGEAHAP